MMTGMNFWQVSAHLPKIPRLQLQKLHLLSTLMRYAEATSVEHTN
eukprot:SAG11_NODE_7534_length_1134_cov_0.929469_1_plen_44_part_10